MATVIDNSGRATDDDAIDLRELLLRLWDGKVLIVGVAAIGAVIAGAIGFLSTPIYRATTVLVPASSENSSLSNSLSSALGSLSGLASLAGVNVGGADSGTEEALAVLRSRAFTQQFIKDNDLLPALFSELWDKEKRAWKVPPEEQPTMARAFRLFNERVRTISTDKKTGLVTLTIDWRDREAAARWANALVVRLNTEMRLRTTAQTQRSLTYLEKELANTNIVETREAINRLIEAQIRQRMLANVTEEYAFRVVDAAGVPDQYDKIWPRKALMIFVGGVLGAVACSMFILLRAALTSLRRPGAEPVR
jgi:uncharacterized protein involved in exopolysaccharide biosynthesis